MKTLLLAILIAVNLVPAPADYSPGKSRVCFRKAVAGLEPWQKKEAYRLTIKGEKVKIEALTPEGKFRAESTLEQLRSMGELPQGVIFDYPRYRHRGMMIDESRSFKGVDFLKKQIDAMALLKMNVLHLHLDDSAGWRIESESYPLLTAKTAWRQGASYFTWEASGYKFLGEDTPGAYGGYYTKEQLRDLVAYAAERYITIIPEIEMPGHSMEVGYAYPEVTCQLADGRHIPGIWDLCPGSEATFKLLESVLDEVMEVFPSPYIHIGGDEAVMKDWARCVHCQARMKEEGLTELKQLQGYLIKRIDSFVRSRGRRIIGWDEILETGVPESATVQSWRGVISDSKGHDIIMSPTLYCYLNYYQDLIRKEPKGTGELISLRRCYSFDPGDNPYVIGLQGNLWCEYIVTPEHAEYMLYPRIFAIAETGWSPAGEKDYDAFRVRARALLDVFKGLGYNCFDMDTESERALSKAFERGTNRGFNEVAQLDGPTLSYGWNSGVRIIISDSQAFRDMNGNGSLDPFEDWRLSPEERAADLAKQNGPLNEIDKNDPAAFISGRADNPHNSKFTY